MEAAQKDISSNFSTLASAISESGASPRDLCGFVSRQDVTQGTAVTSEQLWRREICISGEVSGRESTTDKLRLKRPAYDKNRAGDNTAGKIRNTA